MNTLELMSRRADELNNQQENSDVMAPGVDQELVLLDYTYTSPMEQVLASIDPPGIEDTKGVSVYSPYEVAIVSDPSGDKTYDAATEELLDVLFLIDEDINTGFSLFSDSVNTYNSKSLKVQIKQRDLIKDLGIIFRDWWEIFKRDRNKPKLLNPKTPQVSISPTSTAATVAASKKEDSSSIDLPWDKKTKSEGPEKSKNHKSRGRFGKIFSAGSNLLSKGLDHLQGNAAKLAIGAGGSYLAYNALNSNTENTSVMTPEKTTSRRDTSSPSTLDKTESVEYSSITGSLVKTSKALEELKSSEALIPGQVASPNVEKDLISNSQIVGAAGLTALGGSTIALDLHNRRASPLIGAPINGIDVPRLPAPNLDASGSPREPETKIKKGIPKLGALGALISAHSIYNTATDDSLTDKDKTVDIASTGGQAAAYAATLALGPAAPFALAALGISDVASFAGGLLGYDIPSISGTVGEGAGKASGEIYDYFGFGKAQTQANSKTASPTSKNSPNSPGNSAASIKNEGSQDKTSNSVDVEKGLDTVTNTSSILYDMHMNPQAPVSSNMNPQAPVSSNMNPQAPVSYEEPWDKEGIRTRDLSKRRAESSIKNSIFRAAASMAQQPDVDTAYYSNTSLADIEVQNLGGSQAQLPESPKSVDIKKKQSLLNGLLESIEVVTKNVYISTISNKGNTESSAIGLNTLSTGTEIEMGGLNSPYYPESIENLLHSLSKVAQNSDIVKVEPFKENSDRASVFETHERQNQQPNPPSAIPNKKDVRQNKREDKTKTRIVKQTVHPRPTLDDTPTMIGNGGLGLLGITIV
jgi:hypothetical protein